MAQDRFEAVPPPDESEGRNMPGLPSPNERENRPSREQLERPDLFVPNDKQILGINWKQVHNDAKISNSNLRQLTQGIDIFHDPNLTDKQLKIEKQLAQLLLPDHRPFRKANGLREEEIPELRSQLQLSELKRFLEQHANDPDLTAIVMDLNSHLKPYGFNATLFTKVGRNGSSDMCFGLRKVTNTENGKDAEGVVMNLRTGQLERYSHPENQQHEYYNLDSTEDQASALTRLNNSLEKRMVKQSNDLDTATRMVELDAFARWGAEPGNSNTESAKGLAKNIVASKYAEVLEQMNAHRRITNNWRDTIKKTNELLQQFHLQVSLLEIKNHAGSKTKSASSLQLDYINKAVFGSNYSVIMPTDSPSEMIAYQSSPHGVFPRREISPKQALDSIAQEIIMRNKQNSL